MKSPIVLRGLQVGDIGWVAHRQGILYAQEYGWDGTFEALVAEIAAQYVKNLDPEKENAWIAECEGRVVGSVFVVKVSDTEAKLRLLYVEPEMRGTGLGRRLTQEGIAFAKARGYQKLTLWTNDLLHAARRIYQAAGFVLVSEEQHHSFGHDLVGQYWSLDLKPVAVKETA
jgi:GNAT superfamily N-acetyltransferase